ncbi:MAG: flagellar biosynthetic protein FliO [Pseudomonadota bacterium]|nr:flagellar biosynthetic protein FliO [Pseudomonadota bacterium]
MIRVVATLIAAAVALVWPLAGRATEAAPAETGITGGLLQAVLGLGVVLALIWGAAWLMRRLQPSIGGQSGALKLIASQGVGQRERIVVVEIAEQWLVIGVAPGSISSLATLPKGVLAPSAPAVNAFAGILARARGAQRS